MSTLFASASGGNPRRKSNSSLMPREQAFYRRTGSLFTTMRKRFYPKYWASGPNKGKLRVPGRELPFDQDDFQVWFVKQLGGTIDGTCKCRYCPRILTAIDAGVDHVEPVKQGGSIGLDNLALCCTDCNRFKGGLTEAGFEALRTVLRHGINVGFTMMFSKLAVFSISDAAEIERRLKGGVVYHKGRKATKKEPAVDQEPF